MTNRGEAIRRLVIPMLLVACGAGLWVSGLPGLDTSVSAAEPATESVPARVKEIFRRKCFECHGGTKTQAGIRILDRELLVKGKEKVIPGKPDDSHLFQMITAKDESIMPPEGLPPLSSDEIETIRKWISDGAPDFPADVALPKDTAKDPALENVVGVEYVLQSILQHVRKLPADKRTYMRYFSTNHLLTGGATHDELQLHQDALCKAINHLSWEREVVRPEAIEPTSTVFAIDLRKIGWSKQPFETIVDGAASARSTVNLFDLVLLEYPYATIYEDSITFGELAESFLLPAKLVRPIPYVRADWFVSIATQPLLYEDLLQLPMELAELETRLGVDTATNIKDAVAKRAGMTVSGVSRNNRVVERHPSSYGAYWKSFDYSSNRGRENMFHNPIDLQPAGGEMLFSLPNGLHAYFITDRIGGRIEAAPTSIVTDKFAEDKTVRNGLSCMRCHDQGIKSFADNVRPALEKLPGSPGFDKPHALELYVPAEELDKLVDGDRARFVKALESALGHPQLREPLTAVSQRFLDAPLPLTAVSGELGLRTPEGLQHVFRAPHFSSLGLIPLVSQGVIRRDTWEDYYDQIVRGLGLGVPVASLDGLLRTDYPATSSPLEITLGTNRSNNVFAPGDELAVFVMNRTNVDLHVELIGTSARGRKVVLVPSGKVIKPGEQMRFPEEGTIRIQPTLGKEQITLFASEQEFPAAELIRGKDLVDRVVHRFYQLKMEKGRASVQSDPAKIVKKTIEIETR